MMQPGGNIRVGLDLSDIPNPFSYAYNLGRKAGDTITAPSSGGSSDGFGSSVSDFFSSIPNPFKSAYDIGRETGDTVTSTIKAPLEAASSLMTVVKYVMIAGAIFLVVIVGYVVIKWIPVALGLAGSTAHETTKMVPHLLKAAL